MAERPPPPVPAECMTSGNDWFPWYFDRLRKSKWWRRASDLARARSVMLWGEAYKATPAGSLADDDDELAEAAGFGMDVDAFLAAKAEIMAPWLLCSDGRWYHPTVCEVVLDSWERTSERRRAAAAKKAGQRARARGQGAAVPGDSGAEAGDSSLQDRKGQDRLPPTPEGGSVDGFDEAFAAYPLAGRASTSRVKALAAWTGAVEGPGAARLVGAVRAFAASDYAGAEGGKRVPSLQRWLAEGRYEAWLGASGAGVVFAGPAEIRALVAGKMGEAYARSWLDPCDWGDERVVLTPTATGADRLWRDFRGEFTERGIGVGKRAPTVVSLLPSREKVAGRRPVG
jgi:hypothetical protein